MIFQRLIHMKQRYNENWLAFQDMCHRKAVGAYRLRMGVFVGSLALVLLLVWLACCWAAPAVLRHEARVQAELDAEYEGLQAAYDAEALHCLELELDNMKGDAE